LPLQQWPKWLGTAEFAYNNKVHPGTKVLPFQANSRQNPRIGFKMRKKGRFKSTEKVQKEIVYWDKQNNDVLAPNCVLKV